MKLVLTQNNSEIKIDDIPTKPQYSKQWVIVEITKRDKYGWPEKGKVLYHFNSKEDIVAQMNQIIDKYKDLYWFYTGPIDDE